MNIPLKIAVSGGAGQIAYSLLFRLAAGDLFGKGQPLSLRLLEVPDAFQSLEGVRMELEDCAFPLLTSLILTSDSKKAFEEADYALLIGAKPRSAGMERKDLLADNGRIFVEQGKALNDSAHPNCKVFVVGNPCNTNCLIALSHAPRLSPHNFYAMTRLDQNRAAALLARKARTEVSDVTHVTIWGNHSSTQVPDVLNAKIGGRPAREVISDKEWLKKDFIAGVQQRGAEVIKARGKSSAGSAAHALVEAIQDTLHAGNEGGWTSSGLFSANNPYGIDPALVFSFPCRPVQGKMAIVQGLSMDEDLQAQIKRTENELKEEREIIKPLLGDFI